MDRSASDYRSVLLDAWKTFKKTGAVPDTVPPAIGESWSRCYRKGLSPEEEPLSEVTPINNFSKRQEHLVSLATPAIETMYPIVETSGLGVLLCDAEGTVLGLYAGDSDTRKLSKYFSPGVNMTEAKMGTNSIGLALISGQPVQVSGPEHYRSFLHDYTCAAVTLSGPDQNVVGVICLCGPCTLAHRHTLSLAISLAKIIEKELSLHESQRHITLLDEFIDHIAITRDSGLITFDDTGRLVKISARGVDLLGMNYNEAVKKTFDDIFIGANYKELLREMQGSSSVKKTRLKASVRQGEVTFQAKIHFIRQTSLLGCVCRIKPLENWDEQGQYGETRYSFASIIGENINFRNSIYLAKQAAKSDSRVLLQGESGTGKEVFAQSIHNLSSRRHGPFIAINCSAIPKELLESELFGYDEGAFTGARRGGQKGKFELAQGGTLFLDEIGELPYDMQAKLLRVLEERKMRRVGGNKIINLDSRVISSTNRNLRIETHEKRFRDDLYFRLSVITIYIPPLRERYEDLPHLINHYMYIISDKLGCQMVDIDPGVMQVFYNYHWPGNIRELENIIERCLLLSDGERIKMAHLPLELSNFAKKGLTNAAAKKGKPALNVRTLEDIERNAIIDTLQKTGGKITAAAKILGIGRSTLYRKMDKYSITLD